MKQDEQADALSSAAGVPREWPVFWRVEGSLADLTAVRPVAYFTWNAHTFAERWARRGGLFLQALFRPALVCEPQGACDQGVARSIAWREPRPPGPAWGRVFRLPAKRPPQARGSGKTARMDGPTRTGRAGQPGAGPRHAAAGATPGNRKAGGEPIGVPRRHCHGPPAQPGDSSAGSFGASFGPKSGWANQR